MLWTFKKLNSLRLGEGKKGKADPYQLIKKNEITVDKGEGELRNLRICGGSRSLRID